MCGITGFLNFFIKVRRRSTASAMMSIVNHRGPDESGMYLDNHIAMGHTRLSIIDLVNRPTAPAQ